MKSKDSTGKDYGSQQRTLIFIHYGLSGGLWIANQHIAESPTRGSNDALVVSSLWLKLSVIS